jgi:ribosome-associated protein
MTASWEIQMMHTLDNKDEKGQYIELAAFVKLKKKLSTGGQAKVLVKSGQVFVNGSLEMRAKKKLRKGDLVSIAGSGWMV